MCLVFNQSEAEIAFCFFLLTCGHFWIKQVLSCVSIILVCGILQDKQSFTSDSKDANLTLESKEVKKQHNHNNVFIPTLQLNNLSGT